jgi:hypothetical protein
LFVVRLVKCVLPYLALSCCLMAAESPDIPAPADWADSLLHLPVTRWIMPWLSAPPASAPTHPPGTCKAAPLPPIVDPEALEFEANVTPHTEGLVPAMTRALQKFEQLVSSMGGTFVLKSAYRPPAYQAHLQQVWFAWMELRDNHEPGCHELRSEVEAEFVGHHLIESQKPVNSSDHTRGLAFDATVFMPPVTPKRKTPVSLDLLALRAGIVRPDIVRDPVHYKLVVVRERHASSTE